MENENVLLRDLQRDCVYKYVLNGVVLYVGRTQNLRRRLSQHCRKGDNVPKKAWGEMKKAAIFVCFVPNYIMADVIESEMIRRYEPKYNKAKTSAWCGLPFMEPEWIPVPEEFLKPVKRGRDYKELRDEFMSRMKSINDLDFYRFIMEHSDMFPKQEFLLEIIRKNDMMAERAMFGFAKEFSCGELTDMRRHEYYTLFRMGDNWSEDLAASIQSANEEIRKATKALSAMRKRFPDKLSKDRAVTRAVELLYSEEHYNKLCKKIKACSALELLAGDGDLSQLRPIPTWERVKI